MIKQVYSLVLEDSDEVLGVRIETLNNKKFDLDLDSFHQIVKMDVSTLEPIELMEHGDKLVSEEEFYQNTLVEDASDNPKLLENLKGYFISMKPDQITDKKLLEKRKKRLFELKQSFYSYLPYNMLEDFAEYHLNHFEGNKGIYDTLSKERVNEIHTYSRWRSRMLFEEKSNYQLLTVKPNKAEKLLALMGNSEDWSYDGLIDLGFRGAGHCTLGHALRYQHFAYSPSANRHIAFGKDCIADFFDVPPRVLDEIMNAQEVILKETKAIVYLLNTGNTNTYYQDAKIEPQMVQELIDSNIFRGSKKNAEWLIRMAGFVRVGLPLTRSMVKRIKFLEPQLKEYKKTRVGQDKVANVLKDLEKTSFPQEDVKDLLQNPSQSVFQLLTKKLLLNGDYGHEVVDLYFKYYHDTVVDLKTHFEMTSNRTFEKFIRDTGDTHPFVKDEKRGVLRLVAREDRAPFQSLVRGSIFTKESHDLFTALTNLLLGSADNSKSISSNVHVMTPEDKAYAKVIIASMNFINDTKFHVFTSEFLKEIKYLQDGFPQLETIEESLQYTTFPLKDKAKPSKSSKETKPSKLDTVTKDIATAPILEGSNLEKDEANPTVYNIISELEAVRNTPIVNINPFVYDILSTVHKTGRISEKQEVHIRKGFTQIIENIEDNIVRDGVIPQNDKVVDIIHSYRKYGNLSDKQLFYITKANERILSHHNTEVLLATADDDFPF